jgi:hypothetical protein
MVREIKVASIPAVEDSTMAAVVSILGAGTTMGAVPMGHAVA